jgi:hypothetical protein
MAQSERFYFWRGYYDAMNYLNDGEVGRLFRAICAYAFDGEEPDFGDERVLQVAWTMVADTARESVEMGKRASEYGKQGGRPTSTTKTTPKRPPKRGAKRPPKRDPERVAESVEYGRVLSPSNDGERVGACAPAPDGAARAPVQVDPMLDVPPKPEGY